MKYQEALKIAQHKCKEAGISEQAPFFLMLHLTKQEAHYLYAEYEEEMEASIEIAFHEQLDRILHHEPLDHVLGYTYFYGNSFKVNSSVLIPRPETEELVANVLIAYDEYFNGQAVDVIDVGTGSGAIAITLQLEEANMRVSASDISEDALLVAKENAKQLEADVTFLQGDMLQPFIDKQIKVDILVSNPPYIPQHEQLERSVKDFEPHVALFGGDTGLYFYEKILKYAKQVLKEKSILAFEMGYDQRENLSGLAKQYFQAAHIEVLKDLNGKDRMLFIYNNCK